MARRGSMSLRGWESTRGENSRVATISESTAQAILNARASGEPAKAVAMRYGVSQSVGLNRPSPASVSRWRRFFCG